MNRCKHIVFNLGSTLRGDCFTGFRAVRRAWGFQGFWNPIGSGGFRFQGRSVGLGGWGFGAQGGL